MFNLLSDFVEQFTIHMCLHCRFFFADSIYPLKMNKTNFSIFKLNFNSSLLTDGHFSGRCSVPKCSSSLSVTFRYFLHSTRDEVCDCSRSSTMSLFRYLIPRTQQPHRSGFEAKGNVLISCSLCYTLTVNKKRNKKSSQTWTDNLLLHLSHQANKLLTEKIILTLKVIVATVTLWSFLL